MKKSKKPKEEVVIRANLKEINFQSEPNTVRCSSGWPQNCTIRIFNDMCEAFDYGIELKKQGKLLPRQYNVNPFADVTCEEEGGLLF